MRLKQRMLSVMGPMAAAMAGCLLLTADAAAEAPFDATVVQDQVRVRAGGHDAFYAVGELEAGTPVRVMEVVWGWNRIAPPPGVHSFVLRDDIERDADDESLGRVSAESTEVRAAGVGGESESYRVQGALNDGDQVQIVGQEGPYYRIEPPANAYVYLPPGSVRRGADVQVEQPDAQQELDPESVEQAHQQLEQQVEQADPEGEPQADDTDAETPQAPEADISLEAEPLDEDERAEAAQRAAEADDEQQALTELDRAEQVQTPAQSEAVIDVEQQHAAHFDLPVDEQPLEQMRQAYEQLNERDDLPGIDRRVVQARLAAIEHNEGIAQTLARIREAGERAGARDEPIEPAQQRSFELSDYTAIGQLRASSVYDGESLPRLLRLVDPVSGRTIAYLEPERPIRTREHLGQTVGIVGQVQRDPSLNVPMLEPERVDVLRGQQLEEASQPQ